MPKHSPGKWDVQHHILPDFYVEALRRHGFDDVSGVRFPKWSEKASLNMMDAWGIQRAILSISLPGVHFGDDTEARTLARDCNDFIAARIDAHPHRFGGFASLPLPDVPGAIAEYDRAVAQGGLDGVILMSNVSGRGPGDAAYRPLFERLDRDGAVVFIHPNTRPEHDGMGLVNPFYWWFLDTTRALLDLLTAGVPTNFPNIRFISAHGGGVIAQVAHEMAASDPERARQLDDWKDRLYFDTAKFVTKEAIAPLLGFTSPAHLLFSSDFPWAARNKMRYWTGELDGQGFTDETLTGIYSNNAARLFTRAASSTQPSPPLMPAPLAGVHTHAMPPAMRDAITRLGLDTEQIDWAVPEALAAQAADEDDPIRVALDLPELWTRTADEITAFLSQYNRALAEMAEAHPGQIEAYGAINIDDAAAIEQIEVCDRTPGLAGLCLFPHTSNPSEDTSLMQDVVDALASSQGPIMVHPTDGRGLPVENPERLAAVEFMANLFYTGGIDELQDRTFVLTHTAGIHRVLGDSIGMLYYMRKAHWHMRSFMIDYLLHRDLKGEKVLAEAFAD